MAVYSRKISAKIRCSHIRSDPGYQKIIPCAGYKITDDFPLFGREVPGFTETTATGAGTLALWIRTLIGALLIGFRIF